MPHTTDMIELTLRVETMDEARAAELAERLSRLMIGYSAEDGVTVGLHVDRFEVHCHHDRDEDEQQVEP